MEKKSFEQEMSEIEGIISQMEEGELSLESSIHKYETGMKLIGLCVKKLKAAEKSLKIIEKNLSQDYVEKDFKEHQKEDGSETIEAFKQKVSLKKSKTKVRSLKSVGADKEDMELNLF